MIQKSKQLKSQHSSFQWKIVIEITILKDWGPTRKADNCNLTGKKHSRKDWHRRRGG